jgi:hypothetical protein
MNVSCSYLHQLSTVQDYMAKVITYLTEYNKYWKSDIYMAKNVVLQKNKEYTHYNFFNIVY